MDAGAPVCERADRAVPQTSPPTWQRVPHGLDNGRSRLPAAEHKKPVGQVDLELAIVRFQRVCRAKMLHGRQVPAERSRDKSEMKMAPRIAWGNHPRPFQRLLCEHEIRTVLMQQALLKPTLGVVRVTPKQLLIDLERGCHPAAHGEHGGQFRSRFGVDHRANSRTVKSGENS
ncbi:hypothetical protein D9M73_95490 [compost metagenome]